jgi:hypothetical protein
MKNNKEDEWIPVDPEEQLRNVIEGQDPDSKDYNIIEINND